jgi:hypothetical protein
MTPMVKRLRFLENRTDPKRRDPRKRDHWVFEPQDWAIIAAIVLVIVWLQWLLNSLGQ